jgi:hypothetical protein
MALELTHDLTNDGFSLFDHRGVKVAVVQTKQDGKPVAELVAGAPVVRVPTVNMPRASWRIHFTSPHMSEELVAAVLAALPKEEKGEQIHTVKRLAI